MNIYEIKSAKLFNHIVATFRGSIFHRTDEHGRMFIKAGEETGKIIEQLIYKTP